MRSMIKSVIDNATFRFIAFVLILIAVASMVIAAIGALMVHGHQITALIAACIFIVAIGYYFDYNDM